MVSGSEIRDAFYYLCRLNPDVFNPRFDGGRDRYTGIKYKNKWNRVAEFLNSKNCDDVYGFIYANLYFRPDLEKRKFNVQPTHLYSDAAWIAYQEYQDYLNKTLGGQIKNELEAWKTRCRYWELLTGKHTEKDPAYLAIDDTDTSISPLVRYYLAKKLGYLDLAEKYYRAAEYQFLPAIRAYKKFLPDLDLGS